MLIKTKVGFDHYSYMKLPVVGLRLGVPRQDWKADPLMTSSYSVNR